MKITEALAAEHTIFRTVFDHIERVLPNLTAPSEIKTMARMVEALLQDHAETETSLAYLALDHALQHNGVLDRMHQDHQEIDDRLKQVRFADTCAKARGLLKGALQASREHFSIEERKVFPLLEKTLQPETLSELGQAWARRHAARPARAWEEASPSASVDCGGKRSATRL
jgi:hemerythrin-like domain-containing protein